MPNDRKSRPDTDEEIITSISSVATKALLEGLSRDVRDMRSEVSGVAGTAIRIEQRHAELASHMLENDLRLATIESDFRKHQADENLWQLQQKQEINNLATQLGLVAPLTAMHEQILQQAKGAAWAWRITYVILGALGVGGIEAVVSLLSKGGR